MIFDREGTDATDGACDWSFPASIKLPPSSGGGRKSIRFGAAEFIALVAFLIDNTVNDWRPLIVGLCLPYHEDFFFRVEFEIKLMVR